MIRSSYKIVLTIFSLAIFLTLGACGNKPDTKKVFSIEHFQSEMKAKNYKFEIKDVNKDFLPTERKRMIIGDKAIDIYLFNSSKQMEKEAGRIDKYGSGYSNGSKSIKVDWISKPHFFKKGSIIVQYIGEDKKIISDLKDILGEQFAGDE
ncbi:hypothetical protein NBE98_06010 [Clostridium swellfunianum]|uniref:hypothetical protein n=1 Tax=Clostridium swellfunianum TaxID=1367462 RepID=UPI00203021CC|nr:hypothetical protein [Clostridium swellfunianum]MCM0647926.1 hypothetical protein [Clostridium swellfunianum]